MGYDEFKNALECNKYNDLQSVLDDIAVAKDRGWFVDEIEYNRTINLAKKHFND